jgi:hypothetical protein
MGDLNFRLDDVSLSDVKQRIEANDLESLQQYDQVGTSLIFIELSCPSLGFSVEESDGSKSHFSRF